MKPRLKPSHFSRTAYFIGWLKEKTGRGHISLEKQIRINQYDRYDFEAPAKDTVRDYFRLRRSPAIDPQRANTPPWLFAAELEFPGAAYAFFHPLFDFLFGQMESSRKWSENLERVPEEWILDAIHRGDKAHAEEWRAVNASLKKRRGRPPKKTTLVDLSFIHLTLMRLPNPIFSTLFEWIESEEMFARSYRPVEDEISSIQNYPSMDALAALVGLVYEAAEIGHMNRFHKAGKAVREHLRILDDLPECLSIRDGVKLLIEKLCLEVTTRTYPAPGFWGYGLPETWRGSNAISHLESDLKRIIASVPSNENQEE